MSPISFNEIPSDRRVPFAYIEFDNSRAVGGPQNQVYKILNIGQKLSSGSKAAEEPVLVSSVDQAAEFFGKGSILHKMIQAQFEVNDSTETWALPLDDDGASVQASGQLSFSGAATQSGTIYVYIGGQRVAVPVTNGDAASTVAAALKTALSAVDDLPVNHGGSGADVDIEAKNGGEMGNQIDLRHSYFAGEALPSGLSLTITPMASGSGNPDIDLAFAAIGSEQFNIIPHPYTDQSNLTKIDTELSDRWGPLTQNDGWAVAGSNIAFAAQSTLGNAQNSQHSTIVNAGSFPTLPWQIAAATAGAVAFHGAIDPARPFQTLKLDGVLPPSVGERLTSNERNLLLHDGIATLYADAAGGVRIERLITTYKTNAFGADDTSYLDLNTILTLSYLRFDYRNYFLRKYPRHKLANDGTRFGPGQAIITPKLAKAETIAKFREWENIGLVEGFDQFKNDLIVERNESDPNRLDILLPPDLVNQLRVTGVKIQFLL